MHAEEWSVYLRPACRCDDYGMGLLVETYISLEALLKNKHPFIEKFIIIQIIPFIEKFIIIQIIGVLIVLCDKIQ